MIQNEHLEDLDPAVDDMRHKDIYGKWTGKAIGYCNYKYHPGVITKELARRKHCYSCKYFSAFPNIKSKKGYKNNGRPKHRIRYH